MSQVYDTNRSDNLELVLNCKKFLIPIPRDSNDDKIHEEEEKGNDDDEEDQDSE